MTEGMNSPILGPLEPLLKKVYSDALNEQLSRGTVFYGRVRGEWTPEQEGRIAIAKAKREKERKDLLDLLATAEGTLKAIVELHSVTKYDECSGCDFGGWEGEEPAWPCRTINLIAESLKGEK